LRKIALALGDAGAAQYFMPVVPQLRSMYELKIFADPQGVATKELDKANIPHRVTDGTDIDLTGVSHMLCGTAAKAQTLWRNATIGALRAGVLVAWFGDFVGSGCEPAVRDLNPDFAAVFDEGTKRDFLSLREASFDPKHISVIGNPSFDKIAGLDITAMRKQSRATLGIHQGETLIIYSASSLRQFALKEESLDVLVPWVKKRGYKLSVRFHPSDLTNDAEAIDRLHRWMRHTLGKAFADADALQGFELASAADLFVTDYSTQGFKSCLAGIPTAFLILASAQKYQESRGGKFPYFPILNPRDAAGRLRSAPTVGIFDREFADEMFDYALRPDFKQDLPRRLRQPEFEVMCDGKAGERVLAFIARMP